MTQPLLSCDILAELSKPFPKHQHRSRKLPGGGTYIYIPWDFYMERLNQVCGLAWSSECSDYLVTGDYLSVRCTLRIHEAARVGVAAIHTFPALNEEGKEKIIGTPPQNCFRSAFVDACYQFGVGRYLDDQKKVREWLESSSARGRVNEAMKTYRLSWKQVTEIISANQLPQPEQMDDDECDRLLQMMAATANLPTRK